MNIHSVIEQIENRLKEENIDMDFTKLITIQEMYMYEEFGVDIVERVVELCRSEKLEQEKLITRILEAKDTKNELLGKDDIIRIFKCENEKALNWAQRKNLKIKTAGSDCHRVTGAGISGIETNYF